MLHVAFCLAVLVAPTCSSSSWARNVLYGPKRQDECQPNQFTCTLGACIDAISICNSTAECRGGSDETENACKQLSITTLPETREGCLLPQQPEFGSYTSPACENGKTTCRQIPGTPVPEYWLLSFKCNDGYYINGTIEDKVLLLCNNGKWSEKIPVCRMCGKNSDVGNRRIITSRELIDRGELPWHVGLYKNNSTNHWEQKCGGSLLSPHIVMTAAHCVFLANTQEVLSPTDVKVGLEKYYREWTHDEPDAVKSDVREILIPHRYFGKSASYAQDIALFDLFHSMQINTNIMPVSVDWNHQFKEE